MLDFCLVYMPHQAPQAPSDAIGLLSAQLKQRGRSVRAVYANLRFLESVPRGLARLGFFGDDLMIGDWAFVRDVFGRDERTLDEYVAYLRREEPSLRRTTASGLKHALLRFREQSETFLGALVPEVLAPAPRVVVCVIDHLQMLPSLALLKRVKADRADVVTVTCTLANDETIAATLRAAFSWVDAAIGRDPDTAAARLDDLLPADACGATRPRTRPPESTAGGLDGLPVPDHGDYFFQLASLARLHATVEPRLPVTMSRGCRPAGVNPCFFCGLAKARRPYEARSPGRVLNELDELHARHGAVRFLVTDPMAEIDVLAPVLTACAARGRPYRFFCQVSPGLTRSEVRQLAEGGVDWVQPGIESLDSRILAVANKKNRAWQNILFLKSCGELGVRVNWNLLHGFPGEEDGWYEEMARLIPALAHLEPPRVIDRVRVCRESAYFERAAEFGIQPVPGDAARFVYPLPSGVIAGLTQYFDDAERRRREADDLAFISRLGFFSVKKKVLEWRRQFRGGDRPHLSARRIGAQILVEDTRPVAHARETLLEGGEASVLVACSEAPRRRGLVQAALERGEPGEGVERAIEGLIEKQFVVPVDGRLISLVFDGAAA